MDFVARKKVSLQMSFTILDSLPFPRNTDQPPHMALIERAFRLCAVGEEMADFVKQASTHLDVVANPPTSDPEERARLQAEIDAIVAHDVFGLSRRELCYILDPKDVYGPDFPSETFRVLQSNEVRKFGEYRTRRLVLDAWDHFEADDTFSEHTAAAH
jgi:hypothetical protein